MWESLSPPWQAALEMAWEAYKSGTVPIGAVVMDAGGNIVSRGRNRILEKSAPSGQVCNNEMAHAEINALLAVKLSYEESRHAALFTTMEPCPLCMGAVYMSDIKTLYYAARDPWAGSTNLLGTTPYLSRKPFKVHPPENDCLENALVALHTEWVLSTRGEVILASKFFDEFRAVMPGAVAKGLEIHRSGESQKMRSNTMGAKEFFDWLILRVQ